MAGTLNFTIEQGATFELVMTWEIDAAPVDLTGWSARLQARVDFQSTNTILSLTTDPGDGITLGGAAGTITLDQNDAQTTDLPVGSFVYDLELISGDNIVTRLLQGELIVSAEVTR